MDWGHYSNVAYDFVFILFMTAWSLLALDAGQQIKRVLRKKKEREQWKING